MNRSILHSIAAMLCAITLLASCTSGDKWHVKATIDGAEGKTALLEVSDNGRWIILDSATIDKSGKCSFGVKRSEFPDIYRLTVDSRSVYFPIDSTETVTIDAKLADMDTRSVISGSASADKINQINSSITEALSVEAPVGVVNDSILKRHLATLVQDDWSGIAAYYLINKSVGDRMLYNPAIAFDRGIISAVANAYINFKPDDPRTKLLENMAITSRRAYTPGTPVKALEIYFPEINLKDFYRKEQSLSELWKNSKVIVLNFTAYTADESPAFQLQLGETFKKYHDRGLNIYQVACDPEEYRWRMAAENIPWTAVYCPDSEAAQMLRYNVTALPTTFVIDGSGEHIERVEDISTLDAIVAKYL
ncbi:MAG: redoxin domain-containing protein [Barnesiella sp.]|nr:redoxin domain-containing protein [Barnesiella sp.]